MELKNDFNLTKLFVTKDVHVYVNNQYFVMHLKTIRDMFINNDWNLCYHIISSSPEEIQKTFGFKSSTSNSFDFIKAIFFNLGQYKEFREIYTIFQTQFKLLFQDIDFCNPDIIINGITITPEIWDYIIYILQLSYGDKTDLPPVFDSEEARQFWLAQQKFEEKIKKTKAKNNSDVDSFLKILLSITYSFPSFSFDYLLDQTLAQIQWLQKNAAGAVSYEVNAKAYAAGNMKKGSKLDFFIK